MLGRALLLSLWLGPGGLSKYPVLITCSLRMSSGCRPVHGLKSATSLGGGSLVAMDGGLMPSDFRVGSLASFLREPRTGIELLRGGRSSGCPGTLECASSALYCTVDPPGCCSGLRLASGVSTSSFIFFFGLVSSISSSMPTASNAPPNPTRSRFCCHTSTLRESTLSAVKSTRFPTAETDRTLLKFEGVFRRWTRCCDEAEKER